MFLTPDDLFGSCRFDTKKMKRRRYFRCSLLLLLLFALNLRDATDRRLLFLLARHVCVYLFLLLNCRRRCGGESLFCLRRNKKKTSDRENEKNLTVHTLLEGGGETHNITVVLHSPIGSLFCCCSWNWSSTLYLWLGERCNEKLRLVLLSELTCPCEENLEHVKRKNKRLFLLLREFNDRPSPSGSSGGWEPVSILFLKESPVASWREERRRK